MRTQTAILLLGLLVALPAAGDEVERGVSVGAGIGFVDGSFLLSLEAPYALGAGWSLGPLVQLGFEDSATLVLASANVRYGRSANRLFGSSNPRTRDIELFAQGGLGVSHLSLDLGSAGGAGDTAFLINFGFGAEYRLTKVFSVTSHMLFNFHAGDLFGDSFSYSWQVLGGRLQF